MIVNNTLLAERVVLKGNLEQAQISWQAKSLVTPCSSSYFRNAELEQF